MRATVGTPRLVRSFVQHIRASPDNVFPLLCPEREKEWLPGWDARMLYSASGLAELGAVFETRHERGTTMWLVTDYAPPRRVCFARWQPDGLMVQIEITLGRRHDGSTAVCVCYTYTAISEDGAATLAAMRESQWLDTMAFWEGSMNEWLAKQPAPNVTAR
jgi:hypothetical protein